MSRRVDSPDTTADREIYACIAATPPQPFVVRAGAGSGKTTSLIKALDWVIKKGLTLAGPIIRGVKGIGGKIKAKLRGGDDSPEGKKKRLDAAMGAGVAAANRFGGKPVGDRVLKPLLGAIKFRYGLSVLEPVPQGRNWAVHGEIHARLVPR